MKTYSSLKYARWLQLVALVMCAAVHADDEGIERLEERAQWAYRQRAYPFETIPDDAPARARQQLERLKSQRSEGSGGGNLFEWFNIGPAPLLEGGVANSGRVTSIAVDPANANHWLIGAAQGGIWETWNAGASWEPRTDDQASLAMGAISFSASQPQVIYAGTGEANFAWESYVGAGLLKSVNRGTNWFLLAADLFARRPI